MDNIAFLESAQISLRLFAKATTSVLVILVPTVPLACVHLIKYADRTLCLEEILVLITPNVPLKNAWLDPAYLPKSTKRVALSLKLSSLSALLACTATPFRALAKKVLRSVTKITALRSPVLSTVLSALLLEPVLRLSLLPMEEIVPTIL